VVAWFFRLIHKNKFMKRSLVITRQYFQRIALFLTALLISFLSFAQDKQIDINVNTKKDNVWGQPWVWIVGGAVFILLLVAILRSGGRKNA
jgi:hypothetical protein